jgi:hypothetical protein
LLSPIAPRPLAVASSAAEEFTQDDFEYDHTPTDTQDCSFEGAGAEDYDDEYLCDAATTVSPSSRPPPAMQSGPVPRMPHEVSQTAVMAFDPIFGQPDARPSAMESGPFWSHVAGSVPPGTWREQPPANNPNVTSTVLVRVRPSRWLLTTAVASCVAMLTAFGVVYAFAMARGATAEVGSANIISASARQTGATHLPTPTAPPVVQAPAPDIDVLAAPAAAAPAPAPKHTHRTRSASAASPTPAPAPTTKAKRAAAAPAPQDEDLAGSSSTQGDAKAILDSAL